MANEEMIGYHKGAIATLSKEREELAKIIGIVDNVMQAHLKALKDLGVDLVEQAKQQANSQPKEEDTGNLEERMP